MTVFLKAIRLVPAGMLQSVCWLVRTFRTLLDEAIPSPSKQSIFSLHLEQHHSMLLRQFLVLLVPVIHFVGLFNTLIIFILPVASIIILQLLWQLRANLALR